MAGADADVERAILAALEQSHRELGQQLHDTICQTLSGVRLTAAALKRRLKPEDERAERDLAQIEECAARSVGELHDLVQMLQAAELKRADLPVALEALAGDIRASMACDFRMTGNPSLADDFAAAQLLQIARAIVKHGIAGGRATRLSVAWAEEDGHCILRIAADQPTFEDRCMEGVFGWNLIDRRARAIGAVLEIEEGGTLARLSVPAAAH